MHARGRRSCVAIFPMAELLVEMLTRKRARSDAGGQFAGSATSLTKKPDGEEREELLPSAMPSKSKGCNCRNSRCLKLWEPNVETTNSVAALRRYCECFASGRCCEGCKCKVSHLPMDASITGCEQACCNNSTHEARRKEAMETALERNSRSFERKSPNKVHQIRPLALTHIAGLSLQEVTVLEKVLRLFSSWHCLLRRLQMLGECRCLSPMQCQRAQDCKNAADDAGTTVSAPVVKRRRTTACTRDIPAQSSAVAVSNFAPDPMSLSSSSPAASGLPWSLSDPPSVNSSPALSPFLRLPPESRSASSRDAGVGDNDQRSHSLRSQSGAKLGRSSDSNFARRLSPMRPAQEMLAVEETRGSADEQAAQGPRQRLALIAPCAVDLLWLASSQRQPSCHRPSSDWSAGTLPPRIPSMPADSGGLELALRSFAPSSASAPLALLSPRLLHDSTPRAASDLEASVWHFLRTALALSGGTGDSGMSSRASGSNGSGGRSNSSSSAGSSASTDNGLGCRGSSGASDGGTTSRRTGLAAQQTMRPLSSIEDSLESQALEGRLPSALSALLPAFPCSTLSLAPMLPCQNAGALNLSAILLSPGVSSHGLSSGAEASAVAVEQVGFWSDNLQLPERVK